MSDLLTRAEEAEAERDSQEADFAKSIAIEVASRLKAEAERDEARAQVAAAYEAAAKLPTTPEWRWRFEPRWSASDMATEIRALTPADAQAALEAYGREKVREGMQKAADIAVAVVDRDRESPRNLSYQVESSILAEMEKLK